MFKWIERKILRPIIKNPVEAIIGGAAIATMGPAAAGTIGKLSAGTKVALASSAASTAGAILTRNDAKKENTRVLAANKAESERVYERNKKEVVESREYNTGVRENYYDNLVKDAQKAGINPLTALRAGGGSAYGNAVAGTMAQGVMMDGVYATPTLSRNPIAAGLETGVNVGLAEFTRKQNYSHESRMDELSKELMRAQILSMRSDMTRQNMASTMPAVSNENISVTSEPLLPGQSVTLTELMAKTPIESEVKKTATGVNVGSKIKPILRPVMSPYSNRVRYVPFDPEEADPLSIIGGIGLWAYFGLDDLRYNSLNKLSRYKGMGPFIGKPYMGRLN